MTFYSLHRLISILLLTKYIEIVFRFAYVLDFSLNGIELLELMRMARIVYQISEIGMVGVLVVISSTLEFHSSTTSDKRILTMLTLGCIFIGGFLSECKDYLTNSDTLQYLLSVTPNDLPLDLKRNLTEESDLTLFEPICQVYVIVEFVVLSMTKLVIIVIVQLSIVRLRGETGGTVWTRNKAKIFREMIRLSDFRFHYAFYLVLPVGVRVLKRLAIGEEPLGYVEESLYQFGVVFFLFLIARGFMPISNFNETEELALIKAIKGENGLDETRPQDVSIIREATNRNENGDVELVQT